MEKWSLGPDDLNPHLVYTRISGYGQTGRQMQLMGAELNTNSMLMTWFL
jgi:crotonobetainyl-CoA:carnitine CoA-transferase CaiB-like acyl-CoA transferase